jgi:mono/diheme cytochrome c family protein
VVLPSLQEDIDRLFVKYGVPSDAPVKFGGLGHPTAVTDAVPKQPVTVGQSTGDSKPAEVKVAASGDISAGRELFNGTCAHCHGPDAVQAEKRINLRDILEGGSRWKTVQGDACLERSVRRR